MKRMIWSFLCITGAVYGGLCLSMYLFQERLIFFPSRDVIATPLALALAYENVYLQAGESRIHAWYVPAENARLSVLFCHGNAGNIAHRLETLALFNTLGVNVLIFDYAGFGLSEGKASEDQTYRDADAAWRFLIETKGAHSSAIVLFGRSLGGAVATWIAAREQPGALIVESSFMSVPELGAKLYPILPVRLLARVQYDSAARIEDIDAPQLFVHSRDDEIVPFEQGMALYEKATQPKTFVAISGSHNSGFLDSGADYIAPLQSFLREVERGLSQ